MLEEFQRRSWTRPVILLPGNHDPLTPNSIYAPQDPFRRGLPAYVYVVDRDDFTFELGTTAVVYATPCRTVAAVLAELWWAWVLPAAAALTAFAGTHELVFGTARAARRHDALAREFVVLEKELLRARTSLERQAGRDLPPQSRSWR